MRTTLKRGTAGHVAGNGHGGIPISPLTGATRYRTKRRGPLRLLGKFFLWLAMIVLVAAGALAGGAWLYINESVAEVRAHSQPSSSTPSRTSTCRRRTSRRSPS